MDHFNIQTIEGRRQTLNSKDFDYIVDMAENIYLKKVNNLKIQIVIVLVIVI